jgi:HAMP domain-containing protein
MDQDDLTQDDVQNSNDVEESPPIVPDPQPINSNGGVEEVDSGILEPLPPIEEDTFAEPSKLGLFLRRLLRWLVAVLVIFALGIGATWLARVTPQQKEIEDLKDQLEHIQTEAEESAARVDELLPLIDEKAELEVELSTAELHIDVLSIQADVASAQLALLGEDLVTARASLVGTDTRLEALMNSLEGEDQSTVEGMLTRLDLVMEELGDDSFSAIRDLEVLSSNLAALERSVFGN